MYPRMLIDLDKLKKNAEVMVEKCRKNGMSVAAVTKVFCADERITRAFMQTDVEFLADSRITNIKKYPLDHGKKTMLLRAPMPQQAADCVKWCDVSLISERATLEALQAAAKEQNKRHGVILMVDVGDLREGIYFDQPDLIMQTADYIVAQSHLDLLGLGLNLTCYGAIIPTREKMEQLCEFVARIEEKHGITLMVNSGGNSSSIPLVEKGDMPSKITNIRLGESLARGEETAYQTQVEGLALDAIVMEAGLVEVQSKPSYPDGEIGLNAFGEKIFFEDKGRMTRGIVSLGRQDTDHEGLTPMDPGVVVLGASSDHLIVDLTHGEKEYKVGDTLQFSMNYSAILKGFTSKYVGREYL